MLRRGQQDAAILELLEKTPGCVLSEWQSDKCLPTQAGAFEQDNVPPLERCMLPGERPHAVHLFRTQSEHGVQRNSDHARIAIEYGSPHRAVEIPVVVGWNLCIKHSVKYTLFPAFLCFTGERAPTACDSLASGEGNLPYRVNVGIVLDDRPVWSGNRPCMRWQVGRVVLDLSC